jgi:hypothetical protein
LKSRVMEKYRKHNNHAQYCSIIIYTRDMFKCIQF